MTTHTGGCHCGAVRYEMECDIDGGLECNCSHCGKKGFLLKFLPASLFKQTKGTEEDMTEYRFNKKHIAHRFCKTCGVQTHGSAKDPEGNDTVAVNLRTLDDEVPADLPITKYDGKNA